MDWTLLYPCSVGEWVFCFTCVCHFRDTFFYTKLSISVNHGILIFYTKLSTGIQNLEMHFCTGMNLIPVCLKMLNFPHSLVMFKIFVNFFLGYYQLQVCDLLY